MTSDHMQLRNLQLKQYEILQIVDDICLKHDIKYYLVYGTLLGAVRHAKSIPWDNDIDIAMDRAQFNQFMSFSQELPEDLKLQDICYSSIEYAGLSRVIRQNARDRMHIHIDIFICDYARDISEIHMKVNGALCRFLHIAKLSKTEKAILRKHFKNNFGKRFIVDLGEIFRKIFSSARIEKWIYFLLVSREPTNKVVILEAPAQIMKREWFSDTKMLQYESSKFPVPSGYEYLLRMWYGNYMEIPEEGKKYLREEADNLTASGSKQ